MAQQVYRLTIASNCGGQFATNSFHFRFEDSAYASTYAAANALITRWLAVNYPVYKAILPSAVALLSVKAQRVSSIGGFEALTLLAAGQVGSRSGPLQIAGVGALIIYFPINNGKQRGKTFLPGITETDCNNGQMVTAYYTALLTAATDFAQNLVLAGGGAPTAVPVIYTAKSNSSVEIRQGRPSLTIGTQRRRQVPV